VNNFQKVNNYNSFRLNRKNPLLGKREILSLLGWDEVTGGK
jgi:hypothetical protein